MKGAVEFRVYPPRFPQTGKSSTDRDSDRTRWFRVVLVPTLKDLRSFTCTKCVKRRRLTGAVGAFHGHDCQMDRDGFGNVKSAPRGEIGVLIFSRTRPSFPLIVHECSHATWGLFERGTDAISFESPVVSELDERWAQTTEWLFTQIARRFVRLGLYPQ